jgi:hypothetical protein
MPQVGISMPKVLKDWLDNNCAKAGFRYPSQLAVDMLNEALRLPKYAKLPTLETSIMDETVNIGKNAGIIGSRKFSISGAVKDHNETVEGYKKALNKGWITKERYDELEKESEVMHKEVVDEECKKMDKQKQMREPTSEEKVEAEEPKQLGRLPKYPHPELENSEPKQFGHTLEEWEAMHKKKEPESIEEPKQLGREPRFKREPTLEELAARKKGCQPPKITEKFIREHRRKAPALAKKRYGF